MDELVAALRGFIQHGVLHRVDDSGGVQVADVETAEGVVRSAAEVLQLPGLASNFGTDGVAALVLAVGGDQGIPLLILRATGAGMGKLGTGEAMLYALDGSSRVHVKPGGEVRVTGATKVVVESQEVEVTATTSASVTAPEIEATATSKITATAPLTELHGEVNVIGVLKVNGITMNVP